MEDGYSDQCTDESKKPGHAKIHLVELFGERGEEEIPWEQDSPYGHGVAPRVSSSHKMRDTAPADQGLTNEPSPETSLAQVGERLCNGKVGSQHQDEPHGGNGIQIICNERGLRPFFGPEC